MTVAGTFDTVDVNVLGTTWRVVGVTDGNNATLTAVRGSEGLIGFDSLFVGRGGAGGAVTAPGGGGGGGSGIVYASDNPIVTGEVLVVTAAATSVATLNGVPVATASVGTQGAQGNSAVNAPLGTLSSVALPWVGTDIDSSNGGAGGGGAGAGGGTANPGNGGGGGAGGVPWKGGGGGGAGGAGQAPIGGVGGAGGAGFDWMVAASAALVAGATALSATFGGVWTTLIAGKIAGGGGGGMWAGHTAGGPAVDGGGVGGYAGPGGNGSRPGGGGGGIGSGGGAATGGPSVGIVAWPIT